MGFRPKEYDHIVVGAGAAGAGTAFHLSRGRERTLVLERFFENHPLGSSHGRTRILRTAYAEGTAYVPLVLRARELWADLGREAGEEIFRPTGVVLLGAAGSPAMASAAASARRFDLPHELLVPEAARVRFPAFHLSQGNVVLWDPRGGVLFPERAIRAFRRLARQGRATFRWHSPVLRWSGSPGGKVRVVTSRGEYLAGSVAFTSGAWLTGLLPELHLPLTVEQQTVYWFRSDPGSASTFRSMPAFVWYTPRGSYYYGTPDVGEGVKVGGCEGQRVNDLARRPASSPRELLAVRRFVATRLPGLPTAPRRRARCLYTNTPDKNFLVDFHPDHPNVLYVSACSGHGFKFASAMGEQLAQAMRSGVLPPLLAPFRRGTR